MTTATLAPLVREFLVIVSSLQDWRRLHADFASSFTRAYDYSSLRKSFWVYDRTFSNTSPSEELGWGAVNELLAQNFN